VQPLPDAPALPLPQPAPARHAGAAAHLPRQHAPRDATAEHEQDPGHHGPVIHPGPPSLPVRAPLREERLDDRPEFIRHEALHAPKLLTPSPGCEIAS
jgi:hypothetical protein